MLLPSRLTRVGSLMFFLRDRIVHPVGVGGDENIRRRALFDLFGQRRARGIAGHDLDAGLRGVGRVDLVERVLHRGCGKHGEALVLRQRRRIGRSAQQRKGGEKPGQDDASWRSMLFAAQSRANQALVMRCEEMRQAEAPFRESRRTYDRSGHRSRSRTALSRRGKGLRRRALAPVACNVPPGELSLRVRRAQHLARQAAGNCAKRHRRLRLRRLFRAALDAAPNP